MNFNTAAAALCIHVLPLPLPTTPIIVGLPVPQPHLIYIYIYIYIYCTYTYTPHNLQYTAESLAHRLQWFAKYLPSAVVSAWRFIYTHISRHNTQYRAGRRAGLAGWRCVIYYDRATAAAMNFLTQKSARELTYTMFTEIARLTRG